MDSIGICNMAIGLVSGNEIMTFEDDTVESDACKTYYETARDFCLEGRDWTFASKRVRLTPLTTSPVSEYSYKFQLSSDHLVTRQVSDNDSMLPHLDYQQEEREILANASIIYVRYTKKVTNTAIFSPSFNTSVAHKLAEFISMQITANTGAKIALNQEATNLMETGGAINGQQGSPKRATASRLLAARRGYGSQAIYDWGY